MTCKDARCSTGETLSVACTDEMPDAARFFSVLFDAEDLVLLRPIETWTETQSGKRRKRSQVDHQGRAYETLGQPEIAEKVLATQRARAEETRTNIFFGVAPRFGARRFDEAWQIRRVTSLWADVDHATVDDVAARIATAGLPTPSIVVGSGNGAHVYWLLDTPYLIDDAADPPAIEREFRDGAPDRKKKDVRWFCDPAMGQRVDLLRGGCNAPALSPKAVLFQDVLAGIADKIGGDHTHDLARLLRVPGTLNRKDQRNGRAPVPCLLHTLGADRRYAFELFRPLAEGAPGKVRRESVAKVRLPSPRKPSAKKQDKLHELILRCTTAAVGARSEADFALCCWAIENGVDRETVWAAAHDAGKFEERGEAYFEMTWTAAQGKTREKIFDRIEQETTGNADKIGGGTPEPIIMVGPDEHRVANEAIELLAESADIFQRGRMLVHVVCDAKPPKGVERPPNLPTIATVAKPRLCKELSARASWMVEKGDKKVRVAVPERIVAMVDANGEWPGVRPLEGIVECPTLRKDGSILETPGYDEATGLMVMLSREFPAIPENPTRADALRAVDELMEVWQDFPFVGLGHDTVPLAATLTMLARHSISGPVPLFAIDANTGGAGKGKLCDTVAIIASGQEISRTTAPEKSEEWAKMILSIALGGDRMILLDNVEGAFGNKVLDAALTANTFGGRMLGLNKVVSGLPLNTVWFATGNNLEIVGDTQRRALRARIECLEERPEARTDFAHPELVEWVMQERPRLVAAGLTILRAWIVAGRPSTKLAEWGSYESWSRLIRQPIAWLGLADPASTRTELPPRFNRERTEFLALLDAWMEADPLGRGRTVAEVVRMLESEPERHTALRHALTDFAGQVPAGVPAFRSIGSRLGRVCRQVVDGRYFDRRGTAAPAVWFVARVPQGDSSDSSSSFSKPRAGEEDVF